MSDSEDSSSDDWPVTGAWLEDMLSSYHARQRRRATRGSDGDVVAAFDDDDDDKDAGGEPPPPVSVREFTVRPGCDAGESVLSDILAVAVAYTLLNEDEGGGEPAVRRLDLIMKLLPHDPFSRYFVTEAQFDLREIKFYTQVVPELEAFQRRQLGGGAASPPLPIPRCYHARYAAGSTGEEEGDASPTPCESVLVLENLKTRGFAGADFSRGLSLRQAAAALDAVARLHALSLALKVKEGRPLAERYPFLFQTARATDSYQQLVERGLPQLARFLERRPGMEQVLAALSALRPATKEAIASLLAPQEPLALITHTDFWCNNLLFREEGRRDDSDDDGLGGDDADTDADLEAQRPCTCSVLDWQMVTYSRPTNDVALLLISSLPTVLRRKHTERLLDGYWAALTRAAAALGVRIEDDLGYDRARLAKDYRRSQLLALLLCVGSVDVALGDPRTEQRLLDVLTDLHNDGVLHAGVAAP